MKTSKPLLTLRMLFPAAASFIVLLLGEVDRARVTDR